MLDDGDPIGAIPAISPEFWSKAFWAIGRGLVGGGCLFSLSGIWALSYFRRGYMMLIYPLSEPTAERCFWDFVVGSTIMGFLIGVLDGRTKVDPWVSRTSLGAMLGGLAGVIVVDLGVDSRGADLAAVLTCLPTLGMVGGLLGFCVGSTRTLPAGDTVEARPPGPERPPLWDRETDG